MYNLKQGLYFRTSNNLKTLAPLLINHYGKPEAIKKSMMLINRR